MGKTKIIVIGGGPGGYEGAIEATKLGADVILIERNRVGGTCLNEGCIPTKALYSSAKIYKTILDASSYGLEISEASCDYERVVERKDRIIDELSKGVTGLLKKYKVDVRYGKAKLIDRYTVEISYNDPSKEREQVSGEYIIIATGSVPKILPIDGIDACERILTSSQLLSLNRLPKNLLVVGGGVIGLEFASIMNALGVQVMVIEHLDNILPSADLSIGKRLKSYLKKGGIEVINGAKVEAFSETVDGVEVCYKDKKGEHNIVVEKVLISTGRTGNVESLNLDDLGIEIMNHFIVTNDDYQTNVKNIYAIGDINGKWLLAHAATKQGVDVVNSILRNKPINKHPIPSVVFTLPEVAMVGITEEEAKKSGLEYRVGKALYSANGKAKAIGKTDGFVKVIVTKDRKIVGVHIIGEHAEDMIHEATVIIEGHMTLDKLVDTVHAHPTLSEIFYEAIKDLTLIV